MTEEKKSKGIGEIVWTDLTVPNATEVRDFYKAVTGWDHEGHNMGDYEDYVMKTPERGDAVSGICYSKGTNANVPPQWLIYVTVESVEKSIEQCKAKGGKIMDGPRMMGKNPFCVVQDPAGAMMAIIENN